MKTTYIIPLQIAQNLFGLLLGLSLLLLNVDDGRGSHARCISLVFITGCVRYRETLIER